jgi:ABC-type transporter Mla subunit MlaD
MDMLSMFRTWTEDPSAQLWAPSGVVAVVGAFCLIYLFHYFVRSFVLAYTLKKLNRGIKAAEQSTPAQRRGHVGSLFKSTRFEHLWREYSETLHDQFEVQGGERHLLRSRATASAASFFTAQNMVETPLVTEFYKHLPGILTGVGIVGTFFGLMLGLQHFDPATPEQVNASVDKLLKDVLFAFAGSFVSILASILVTVTEKWRLGRCYRHLESLTEGIDGLFDSGVGEEYLAELVKSSSESAVQTRQLKDSLVTDLREMLQNLVDTQVRENLKLADTLSASYRDSGQALAEQIGGAIESSLKTPLEQIAGAVQSASGDQSNQVQHLLQDVLVAFMNKLESSFGQQFNGLHDMLGQSVSAMQSMQQGFNALVQDMRSASEASSNTSAQMITQLIADMQAGQNAMQAGMNDMLANLQVSIARMGKEGEGAGERMARQLEQLFADSEARQQAMAQDLQAFVETMKQNIGHGQQETMARIASSVDVLGEQLGGLFKQMEASRVHMDQASRVAQSELHEGTRQIVGGLESQVGQLLEMVSKQNDAMRGTLGQLSAQTEQHLQSMQLGADKMRLAAERFDSAGQSVSRASEATAGMMGALQGTGTELVGASRELSSVVADYRNNREALNQTLTLIQDVVGRAQQEAAGRSQYLHDLKQQGEGLQRLNREVHEYLEHVSQVLGDGFNEFNDGMERSLRQTLGSLDTELQKAVTSLAGGVDVVKESLEDFSDIMERVQRR